MSSRLKQTSKRRSKEEGDDGCDDGELVVHGFGGGFGGGRLAGLEPAADAVLCMTCMMNSPPACFTFSVAGDGDWGSELTCSLSGQRGPFQWDRNRPRSRSPPSPEPDAILLALHDLT